jgi:hypothetical protein
LILTLPGVPAILTQSSSFLRGAERCALQDDSTCQSCGRDSYMIHRCFLCRVKACGTAFDPDDSQRRSGLSLNISIGSHYLHSIHDPMPCSRTSPIPRCVYTTFTLRDSTSRRVSAALPVLVHLLCVYMRICLFKGLWTLNYLAMRTVNICFRLNGLSSRCALSLKCMK